MAQLADSMRTNWTGIRTGILLILTTMLPVVSFANVPGGGTGTGGPVTLTTSGGTVTMSNGIVSIVCTTSSATITQINYTYNNGSGTTTTQMLNGGYDGGEFYWETGGFGTGSFTYSVVVNPSSNGGAYGEIDLLSTSASAGTMDVHYSMLSGSTGFYTTVIFGHRSTDAAETMGEMRSNIYAGSIFNWMSVDANRNRLMNVYGTTEVAVPGAPQECYLWTSGIYNGLYDDKYKYSADLGVQRVWGWSSVTSTAQNVTGKNVGLWNVTSSAEYYNGGPMKRELMCHIDTTILNMLHGTHYGGGNDSGFAANEVWTHTYGPYFTYCNNIPNTTTDPVQASTALYADAQAQAAAEATAWPYTWFNNSNYPQASGRGTVTGKIVISDTGNPNASAANLWVGLIQQPSTTDGAYDFQTWMKPYQFWIKTDANGNFTLPNVIAGTNYTLYAFGPGSPGMFQSQAQTGDSSPVNTINIPASPFSVTVTGGATTSLGNVTWTPTRVGSTVFEIGYPDRTSAKFRHGDDWWVGDIGTSPITPSPVWDKFLEYPFEFPSGPNYTVGTSRWSTDWDWVQPTVANSSGTENTSSSNLNFNLASAPAGGAQASLYIATSSDFSGPLVITVNGTNLGSTTGVTATPNSLSSSGYNPAYSSNSDGSDTDIREGIHGMHGDERITFPGSLLKSGSNTINFKMNGGGSAENHAMYDYIRLELTGYVPPAPGSVTTYSGNNCNLVTWPVTPGATSYDILRSTTSGSGYTSLATNVTGPVCGSGLNNATYLDTTAVNGTTYYYVVQSVNPTSASANSTQSAGVAPSSGASSTAPAAPTNLTATPGNGQIALSWTASAGANYYTVQRSTMANGGTGTYIPLSTITLGNNITGTTYTDVTTNNGSTYSYTVAASNAGGTSANSTATSAVPVATAPATAPTGVSATPGNLQVSLSWSAVTGAVGYVLQRATTSGGPYTYITSVSETTYVDSAIFPLSPNTTYYYIVTAVNSGGSSPNSTQVSATTAPAAPTNLAAIGANAQVVLTWSAAPGATKYTVQRSTSSTGTYTTVSSTVTTTSYTNTGLTNGTTYYYEVIAFNGSDQGGTTAPVSATPAAVAPPNPQSWNGGDTSNGHWSDGDNWVGGTAPGSTSGVVSTDIATFYAALGGGTSGAGTWGNSTNNPVVIDSTTQNIGGVNFDTGAGSYFIGSTGSNSLLLSSGGTIQLLSTMTTLNAVETVNAPLVLEGSATFANNNATGATFNFGLGGITAANSATTLTLAGSSTNANTISGVIGDGAGGAGGMSVAKSGAGTWILSGANTYTGTTIVSGGILQLNAGGVINGSPVSLAATPGAQIFVNGGSLTESASSDIAGNSAGLKMASGTAAFNGGLTINTGNTSTTSLISITGGTLTASSLTTGRQGTTFTSTTAIETGNTTQGLQISGSSAVVNISGALNISGAGTNSSTNAQLNSGTLTVGGVATIGENSTNGRWDYLAVLGGTFTDNDTSGIGIKIGGVTVINGAFNGSATGNSVEFYVNGGTVNTSAITFGDSTQTTGGSDVMHVAAGTLYVGTGGMVNGGTSVTPTITLGATTIGALGNWSSPLNMALGGTTIKTANASGTPFNVSLSGNLSGSTLTETGTGILTLSGANTYTGGTTISSGTMEFATTPSMPSSGAIKVSSGTTLAVMVGGASPLFTNATSGNGSIGGLLSGLGGQSPSTVTWSAGSTLGLDTTSAAGGFSYGAIANTGAGALGLAKLGTGTLTLTGTNTYTGPTTVFGGVLISNNNLTSSSSLTIAAGATLNLAANLTTSGAITNNGTLVLGNGVSVSSTGAFTNNGTLDLTNDSTYTLPGNFVNHGTVLTAPVPADTPTMPQWALIATAGLLLLTASRYLLRRPHSRQ
jgi:autotransporter-associated beta strand protein